MTDNTDSNNLSIKEILGEISETFCLAKLYWTSIDLHCGHSKSCHMPDTHKIPIEEIKKDSFRVFHSKFKEEQIKLMLQGKESKECKNCIKREGFSSFPRHLLTYKNSKLSIFPTDLEIRFSNVCSYKCAYCDPISSSKIYKDIEQFGPYPTSSLFNNLDVFSKQNKLPVLSEENNPYIEKFWEAFPQIYKNLTFIMLTGGEPLSHENTHKLLEFISKNGNSELLFHIITGLGITKEQLDLFIKNTNQVLQNKNIKDLTIQISLDHLFKKAEYIRHGLSYENLINNVHKILTEIPKCNLIIRCTLSVFSVPNFSEFLKFVLDLKKQYNLESNYYRVLLQIHKVTHPEFLSVDILTPEILNDLNLALEFMKSNEANPIGFMPFEIEPFNDLINSITPNQNHRLNFFKFCNEFDLRNDTNFLEIFPELKNFWKLCQNEYEKEITFPSKPKTIAPEMFKDIDHKLNQISNSFCIAKWKQATFHLETGHTHSCHHPPSHPIPLRELELNYKALHNTSYKKLQRKLMRESKRPIECSYCWNLEDSSSNNYSDRHVKSSSDWSLPYFKEIANANWDDEIDPSYLEVSFSSKCNLKCSYCSAQFSSSWRNELERFGSYPFNEIDEVKMTDHNNLQKLISERRVISKDLEEESPYLKAFWNWWPSLHKTLKVFRITGGEPLLNENTFKILEYLTSHKNNQLSLEINSNLSISDSIFERFLTSLSKINLEKVTIFTSLESTNEKAEYARFGLNYLKIIKRIDHLITMNNPIKVVIMSTYNALSVTSFTNFLQDIAKLKKSVQKEKDPLLLIDISYLRSPSRQTIKILPMNYLFPMEESIKYMEVHHKVFTEFEISKMQRIINWYKGTQERENINFYRSEFYKFFKEHDKRRKTRFLQVFPEMSDVWELCKEADRQYN